MVRIALDADWMAVFNPYKCAASIIAKAAGAFDNTASLSVGNGRRCLDLVHYPLFWETEGYLLGLEFFVIIE